MILSTGITDLSSSDLGLVELSASYLNDRKYKQWSQPELTAYINEEQFELAAEINQLHRKFFMTSGTTTSVAGQALYSLPTDMAKLEGIEIANDTADTDPFSLTEVLLEQRNFYNLLENANSKTDASFYFIAGSNFTMKPPMAGDGDTIRVYYIKRMVRLADADDESQIPAQHHELLSMGAAQRALIKVDRINTALDKKYQKRHAAMMGELSYFSLTRENRKEPFRGSYGPPAPPDERFL